MRSLDIFLSQVFLSLETFLQKATTLNIFEALIFNYKIKINSVEQCSPQFVAFVVDLCNELQLSLRDCVVETVDKLDDVNKPETTFCDLQPEDPISSDFGAFTSSEPDKQVSEPNNDEDFTNKQTDVEMEERSSTPLAQEKQKTIYTCDFCNRKYRTNEKFTRHVCKSVPSSDTREDEMVDDPGSPVISQSPIKPESASDLYVCAVCLSSFSQRALFDQHSHTDTTQEAELLTDAARLQSLRKFTCGVCGEVYRSLARISYHVAHCRAGPYHCELCPYLAHTKQLLNRHKKKHHKGVESFFCSDCGLGFKLRTSLQKHMVNRHENVRDHFPCDTDGCHEVFSKKIHLTNHRIEVHGVQRKFLCQVCGHKFMTQDSLSSHLECHANKRRFECQFCSKLFNTKEKLTFHVRTHTGERPYVCERAACCKSFVSKSKLMEHIQRHNGEKRHKCGVCGKQYANKPDLRAHLRKQHPTDLPSECVVASEPADTPLYPSQLMVPPYSNMQFYPVSVPQNVVITSYESVVTM